MATAPIYCTHKELKRVYPQVDAFDTKTPIYGWNSTDTTNQYQANNTGLITQLYFDGVEGTAVTDNPNANYEYNYSSATDSVQVFLTTSGGATLDPNDILIEAGEDFTTLITQFRTDASRYLDSKLDPNLPREQLKDKSGNFDYLIIRTTALIASSFLIRATDPTNEVATALMEEAQGNIDSLNTGNSALSWQTTRDASSGIIRDVTYTSGSLRPVDTRGIWHGTFDMIKLKVTTAGVLGVATYSVWVKDGDKLKTSQVVTDEKINGDYQTLASGLQIRFAGDSDSDVATINDEWEIEVMGANEATDSSGVKSVQSSRWR